MEPATVGSLWKVILETEPPVKLINPETMLPANPDHAKKFMEIIQAKDKGALTKFMWEIMVSQNGNQQSFSQVFALLCSDELSR